MNTDFDAGNDQTWFAQHPDRLYFARQDAGGDWWIVKRAGDVLLRVQMSPPPARAPSDTDAVLAQLWTAAAYPNRGRIGEMIKHGPLRH
jgi:hypothetical protein